MNLHEHAAALGPELLAAIEAKGFTELSAVQKAVLDVSLQGRDLRISSQTGSGKTLAIGLTLRNLANQAAPADAGVARPRALVVAPTRELAHQVEQELTWLYASSGGKLASATGGSNYRDEHRALARGPSVVVGTPGRLLDHLKRGAIDGSQVEAIVLDEADRMLDLGFRADLDAIFDALPSQRQTHLVSATFPRAVRSLADSVQRTPALVEGTRLGVANVDIDHVIHVVNGHQRLDAIVNLLLANPDEQTLVFVRTRADASELANELVMAGFAASGLSGEMEQGARTRTLAAFKRHGLRVLVATDVAARGIDVQDVTRVVHAELPTNADAYTHRSGRTGRAGRKGTSSLLVAPAAMVRATRLLRSLGVAHRFEPIPTAADILRSQDERIFNVLTREDAPAVAAEGGELAEGEQAPAAAAASEAAVPVVDEARWHELAKRLVEFGSVERSLSRLLARSRSGPEPRQVEQPRERPQHRDRDRDRGDSKRGYDRDRPPHLRAVPRSDGPDTRSRSYSDRPRDAGAGPVVERERRPSAAVQSGPAREYNPFRVSWGSVRGADARRLLAMVCRRGEIRGTDVGAIHVEREYAIVEVAAEVAKGFARAAGRPDPREPNVRITPERGQRVQTLGPAPGPRNASDAPEATDEAETTDVTSRPAPRKPTAGAKPFKRRSKQA
ncbi:MAG: hypothetical protein RL701_2992 [Pseudomonadota bacterium]